MSKYVFSSPKFSALSTLVLGGTVYFSFNSAISLSAIFSFLTLLLFYYLYGEMSRVRRMSDDRWLLNPAVLCSVVTFILPFVIGNIIYLLPDEKMALVGLSTAILPAMIKVMMLALLASAAMWTGYWSIFAANAGRILMKWPLIIRLNYGQFVPRPHAIIISILLVLFVRLVMMDIGVYGYNSDAASLAQAGSFRQYLTVLELLGKFILIALALDCFKTPIPDRVTKNLLVIVVVFEIIFGLLSGFKSAVVLPVVLVVICYYYCTNKLNFKYISTSIILLLIAYAVIEPYRSSRDEKNVLSATSLVSIVNTFASSISESLGSESNNSYKSEASAPLAIVARMSMAYIASLGVEYQDTRQLPDDSPSFLKDIFISPLYAIVPRVLWSGKESARHGQWYLQEIMGYRDITTSSVGMGPITYLYFAGGWLAVGLGFFFVGIILRVFTLSMLERGGVAYLMMLPNMISIDSVYYSFFIELLRSIPILILFYMFIYKRLDIPKENVKLNTELR